MSHEFSLILTRLCPQMSLVELSLTGQHYGYNIPKNQVTALRVQIYDKLALSYQVLRIKPFPNEDDPNYTCVCVIKTKTCEN